MAKVGARKPRGRPFEKSGNPAGRPKGSRNKKTLLAETLLDENIELATSKLLELVRRGNMQAIALYMKLVFPNGRKRPINLALPPLATAADDLKALAAITDAAAKGLITPDEARDLASLVELHMRGLERADFEERLMRLEAAAEEHHAAVNGNAA